MKKIGLVIESVKISTGQFEVMFYRYCQLYDVLSIILRTQRMCLTGSKWDARDQNFVEKISPIALWLDETF